MCNQCCLPLEATQTKSATFFNITLNGTWFLLKFHEFFKTSQRVNILLLSRFSLEGSIIFTHPIKRNKSTWKLRSSCATTAHSALEWEKCKRVIRECFQLSHSSLFVFIFRNEKRTSGLVIQIFLIAFWRVYANYFRLFKRGKFVSRTLHIGSM